jgi:uncharacterized protein YqgV (UPF0045/DUF77 family)
MDKAQKAGDFECRQSPLETNFEFRYTNLHEILQRLEEAYGNAAIKKTRI